jgi:hypothetical protein
MPYTTQKQIRAAFWEQWTGPRKPGSQNNQTTDTREAFCDFVDSLQRNAEITDALASRATL